jgi:hypothetical protein
MTLERRGNKSTLGLTTANPNLAVSEGVFVAQYLRRLTKCFDFGLEYVYQRDSRIPGKNKFYY